MFTDKHVDLLGSKLKAITMKMDNSDVAARRNDPNYMQIAGDVKKETGLKFKAACMLHQLTLGEGLEQALGLWLEHINQSKDGAV